MSSKTPEQRMIEKLLTILEDALQAPKYRPASVRETIAEANRMVGKAERKPEPAPSYNQHPDYERWKSICPHCRSIHTRHYSGFREFDVKLRCTDCGHQFTLKEAFEAEQKHQAMLPPVTHVLRGKK